MKKAPSLKNLRLLQQRLPGPPAIPHLETPLLEELVETICSQQLSLKAAATIFGRVQTLFPQGISAETLSVVSAEKLKAAGLSAPKVLALQDLALKAKAGIVPTDTEALKLSNEELIARLTQIRGIGQWSVEMILLFRYARPDVWPVDDLGVQKGFRLIFPELKFKTAKELKPLADFYRGKRSELAWYSWRALDEERAQTITAVPLTWQGLKLQLWLKGELPLRLDFTRKEKTPTTSWPGTIKTSKTLSKDWQKHLERALKLGPDAQMLELVGTPLQQQVWAAIAAIPWGKTKSYKEIAEDIGKPKAFRAVAQACGANPLPLFIPCHRVVGTGNLGGFSGGLKVKEKLLKAEGLHGT